MKFDYDCEPELTEEGCAKLIEILSRPPRPLPKLVALFKRHRTLLQSIKAVLQ